MAQPQIIVVPSEAFVHTFTGTSPRELSIFQEELGTLWLQRPDVQDESKGRMVWTYLAEPVRRELRCQGLGPTSSYNGLMGHLKTTYGERRSLAQLAMKFHSCHQEEFESLRHFSQRLHEAFSSYGEAQKRLGVAPVERSLLRDQYIDGVSTEGLKLHLRQYRLTNPNCSFQELRDVAMKLQGGDEDVVPAAVNVVTQAPVASSTPDVGTPKHLLEALSSLPALLENLSRKLDRLTPPTPAQQTTPRPPTQAPGQPRPPPQRPRGDGPRCYACNRVGHFARECRSRQQQPGNGSHQ